MERIEYYRVTVGKKQNIKFNGFMIIMRIKT